MRGIALNIPLYFGGVTRNDSETTSKYFYSFCYSNFTQKDMNIIFFNSPQNYIALSSTFLSTNGIENCYITSITDSKKIYIILLAIILLKMLFLIKFI